MKQVYNSRRSTMVDKFLEQALMRCSNKQSGLAAPSVQENKPIDIKPVLVQKPLPQRKSITNYSTNASTTAHQRNNRPSIIGTEKPSLTRQSQPLIHKVTSSKPEKKYGSVKIIDKKP